MQDPSGIGSEVEARIRSEIESRAKEIIEQAAKSLASSVAARIHAIQRTHDGITEVCVVLNDKELKKVRSDSSQSP
jgi:hypothetical protein